MVAMVARIANSFVANFTSASDSRSLRQHIVVEDKFIR